MKTLLIAATLTLTTASAFAEERPSDFCASYHKLGTNIMKHRQYNDNVVEALDFSDNEIYRKFVIIAYKEQRFSTEEYRQRKIKSFANSMFIGCLKAFGEDI